MEKCSNIDSCHIILFEYCNQFIETYLMKCGENIVNI